MVKTVLPTRGLIYAKTLKSLQENGVVDPIIIDGLGIPEAQNTGVEIAMKDYCQYIFMVEDDMVIPPGTLTAMIKTDKPIVAVDYPVDNGFSTVCRRGEEVLWCGLGCTLIRRGVFEAIGYPYFTTDYSWRIDGSELTRIEAKNGYGGHDINFCLRAKELGFPIHVLSGVQAQHLRTPALQRTQFNDGSYQISPLSLEHEQRL